MWEVTNFGKQWLALCRSGKYNVGVFVQVIAMLKERLRNGAIFEFYDPGQLVDGDLTLVLYEAYPGDERRGYVPAYRFRMMRGDSRVDGRKQEVGRIEHTPHRDVRGAHRLPGAADISWSSLRSSELHLALVPGASPWPESSVDHLQP